LSNWHLQRHHDRDNQMKPAAVHCIPFKGPSAASCKTWFTSSANVFFQLNYEIHHRGVGTRNATPFSLPFKAGTTRATALAAPVEVGTMFIAAALARRNPVTSVGAGRQYK